MRCPLVLMPTYAILRLSVWPIESGIADTTYTMPPQTIYSALVSVLQFIIGEICSEHTMRPGRYRLGLVRFKIMLLGTSRSRYPMKKMDTARE